MKLFEFFPDDSEKYPVEAWLQQDNNKEFSKNANYPAVIICPGGGYSYVSPREGEPIAKPFFAAGYNVFIISYPVGEMAGNFQPLCQLASTIAYIRRMSDEWYVEKDKIAVCGFSAGGHLAASLGTLYNKTKFLEAYGKTDDIRPNAMILGYPVITADEFAHVSSIEKVSGAKVGSIEYEWFGLDKRVDSDTPPAFIWHTSEDASVPAENSLSFAAALSRNKVPYELHILPYGEHGMSSCTNEVGSPCDYNGRWITWCLKWLNNQFDYSA